MAERVDVLQRPVGAAIRPCVDARLDPGGPSESLHLGIAVTVGAAGANADGARSMKSNHTAVEHVFANMQQNTVRQVDWKMRRVAHRAVEVLHLRRPPADVDVSEHDTAATLKQHALVGRHVDRDGGQNVRVQDQVIGARSRLVELRPHRRVLELQVVARVLLRESAPRSPRHVGGAGRCGRRGTVVVERELRRRERRGEDIVTAER